MTSANYQSPNTTFFIPKNGPFITFDAAAEMLPSIKDNHPSLECRADIEQIFKAIEIELSKQYCLDSLPGTMQPPKLRHPISNAVGQDVIHKSDLYYWLLKKFGVEVVDFRPYVTLPISATNNQNTEGK